MRVTPNKIKGLQHNEVFVFGSNLAGRHGKGAALFATKWGAVKGQGVGLMGSTYAIPTKDHNMKVMEPAAIKGYVDNFCAAARARQAVKFYVTKIGCGLAGLTPKVIAPMFNVACTLPNVYLPEEFWDVLNEDEE